MSSPSRIITATDASSSNARGVVTGTRTDARDLAPFAGLDVPARERGALDNGTDLDRLARALTSVRDQRVGCVGGVRLTPTGPACVSKDAVGVRLPCRAETSTGVRRQAGFEAVRAIGIGPLVCSSSDVQPTRPRGVVGLRTGAYHAAPVAQTLHTSSGCRLQQRGLGGRIGIRSARDLGGLRRRELPGPKRGISLGQAFERTRSLERTAGGADRLARRLGDPVRGAAVAPLSPGVGLLDATRAERLDRRTDPLAAGRDLDKRRRGASVEAARIERT
jgi:hypothetical protein